MIVSILLADKNRRHAVLLNLLPSRPLCQQAPQRALWFDENQVDSIIVQRLFPPVLSPEYGEVIAQKRVLIETGPAVRMAGRPPPPPVAYRGLLLY